MEDMPPEILIKIFTEAVTSSSKIKIRNYDQKHFWSNAKAVDNLKAFKLILPVGRAGQESRVIPALHLVCQRLHAVLRENKQFHGNQLFYKQNIFEFDTANLNWLVRAPYEGQPEFTRSTEVLRKVQNLEWVFKGGVKNFIMMIETLKRWTSVKHLKVICNSFEHIPRLHDDLAYRAKYTYGGQYSGRRKIDWESFELVVCSNGVEVLLTRVQQAAVKRFTEHLKNSMVE